MPAAAPSPLAEVLARHTREGELYEKLPESRVRCFACGHRCLIPPGHEGICKVRFNDAGVLRVPHGYVGALQVDPVEKKPSFTPFPGRGRCPSACSAAITTAATASCLAPR